MTQALPNLHPTVLQGDMREVLRALPENHFHSVVTDPPYHLTSVVKRFGKEGSSPAKFGTDGAFSRASAGFMGKCYHPGTEVLTDTGWKPVGSIRLGEPVYTLNLETREAELQPVSETYVYPFDGELVHLKHRSSEQVVTPNHSCVVSVNGGASWGLLRADSLPRQVHLAAQANPMSGSSGGVCIANARLYGKNRETKHQTRTYPAKPFFKFFGLWLGDGYTTCRKDDHPANDFFGINVKKPRKVSAVRECLQRLGIRYTETPSKKGGTTAFYCYDFVLLEFLKPLGNAYSKRIPEWMFSRSSDDLEHLYQGMIETDGCKQGKDQEVYYTVSKLLSDDFQRLCLHTGRSAAITRREAGEVYICGRPSIKAEDFLCCVLQRGKRLYGEIGSGRNGDIHRTVPYVGEVYCLTVAKHHTLYTRFNGKPAWSGNSWDGGDIAFDPETWREVYRVMRPGAYLAAFGGTRTFCRMAVAIEDAGFDLRDTLMWLYATGMPKSHSVTKEIDAKLGQKGGYGDPKSAAHAGWIERGQMRGGEGHDGWQRPWMDDPEQVENAARRYVPATAEAAAWDGWGSALKPAFEPIVLARKPVDGTLAGNALKWGTGLMNIDESRISAIDKWPAPVGHFVGSSIGTTGFTGVRDGSADKLGRWPANILTDGSDEVRVAFPDAPGQLARSVEDGSPQGNRVDGAMKHGGPVHEPRQETDKNASRFFATCPYDAGEGERFYYSGKATKADRQGTSHPTTKPISLMQWVARLITPKGGTVLDPFAGSGSTGTACIRGGFAATLVERETEYVEMIHTRIAAELGEPTPSEPPADTASLEAELEALLSLEALLAAA